MTVIWSLTLKKIQNKWNTFLEHNTKVVNTDIDPDAYFFGLVLPLQDVIYEMKIAQERMKMRCLNFEELCRANKGSNTMDGSLLYKNMVVDHQPCQADWKGRGIPTLPDGVYLTFDTPGAHLVIKSIVCWWLGRKLNGLTSCNAGRDQNES